MVLANVRRSGGRETVFNRVGVHLGPTAIGSAAARLACNLVEAWAQTVGFIGSTRGKFQKVRRTKTLLPIELRNRDGLAPVFSRRFDYARQCF
jgi:hypothetical protein